MNKETLIFVGSTGLIGREVLESLSKKDKKIYLLLRRLNNTKNENINILRPGHIIINKSKSEIGLIVWLVDLFFKLVNPFLIGFLSRYRGISLKDISIFMANKSVSGIKIFYYDDFIK